MRQTYCKPQLGLDLSPALKRERATRGQGSTLQPSTAEPTVFLFDVHLYMQEQPVPVYGRRSSAESFRPLYDDDGHLSDFTLLLRCPVWYRMLRGNELKALRKRIQRDYAPVHLRRSDSFANVNEERRHKAITAQRG